MAMRARSFNDHHTSEQKWPELLDPLLGAAQRLLRTLQAHPGVVQVTGDDVQDLEPTWKSYQGHHLVGGVELLREFGRDVRLLLEVRLDLRDCQDGLSRGQDVVGVEQQRL